MEPFKKLVALSMTLDESPPSSDSPSPVKSEPMSPKSPSDEEF